MGRPAANPFGNPRQFWRWDVILGAIGVGAAVASAGQAAGGNGADEWIFSVVAVALLTAAAGLLARARRYVEPFGLSFLVAYCAVAGLDNWHLRWWIHVLAWIGIVTPIILLAGRWYEASHKNGESERAKPPSAVDG